MKKFVIISIVLLLLAAGAFGFALYRYMQVNDMFKEKEPEAVETVTEAPQTADATEAANAPANAGAADTKDVFASGADQAATFMADMTTEEMVGQLVMGICADSSTVSSEISKYSLAGMLFESGNFYGMTKEEVSSTLSTAGSQAKVKPILAAQEEGGVYTTVSDLDIFPEYDFNAPRSQFDTGGLQAVEKDEEDKTTMLKSIGVNLNLAPVVNVTSDDDEILYSRSLGSEVDTIAAYAEYAAKFNQAKGVSVALKYFPCYGSAYTADGGLSDDRDAETIRSADYTPFKKGAAAGAHVIMVSNALVQNLDATHIASLSPTIIGELRGTVGFTGIIMTDVLDDTDYSAYADGNRPAVQAILAGNDIVLVRDYETAYNDILAAVNAGTVSETQLKTACSRVLAYKYTAGVMK